MKNSGYNYWGLEYWRLAFALFTGFLGGLLTGYWQASFLVTFFIYILWLLFKIKQLHKWLEKGGKAKNAPESNGIWERINYHIQYTRKKSDLRKQRMSLLLKRFQGIITSLPYATVVLNGRNEIDWANKASKQLLNIDIKSDRGQRIDNLIRIPKVQKLLTNNKQKEIEVSTLHNSQAKLAIQLIPVEGDLKLLIARDISERVSLQEMRKNFISNASHELRTPLTVIAGYLEIMQTDDQLPRSLEPAVQAAAEQSTRMQSIIEDLLTLSRLENSELDDEKTALINVAKIITQICHNEQSIDNNSHKLVVNLDESLLLHGITTEVTSVFSNLIHNAIRYTPKQSTIEISWYKTLDSKAVFSVKDNGEGIAPEHISHLTERFYRIDNGRSREAGGTGLGLAIVQHIVQRHGGQLKIESQLGKGSTFSTLFPL